MKLSARNVISPGTVSAVNRGQTTAHVKIDIGGGNDDHRVDHRRGGRRSRAQARRQGVGDHQGLRGHRRQSRRGACDRVARSSPAPPRSRSHRRSRGRRRRAPSRTTPAAAPRSRRRSSASTRPGRRRRCSCSRSRPRSCSAGPRRSGPDERPFVPPKYADLPTLGRLTGRGNTANVEVVLAAKPDLIVDYGSIGPTYVSLADRVQAADRDAVPPPRRRVRPDSGIAAAPRRDTRRAGARRGVGAVRAGHPRRRRGARRARFRASAVRASTTGAGRADSTPGSPARSTWRSIERMGATNVAAALGKGGLVQVSVEQVLAWDPDAIVTIDRTFYASLWRDPLWQGLKAVQAGKVFLSPNVPYGWIDFPPSINRLVGLALARHAACTPTRSPRICGPSCGSSIRAPTIRRRPRSSSTRSSGRPSRAGADGGAHRPRGRGRARVARGGRPRRIRGRTLPGEPGRARDASFNRSSPGPRTRCRRRSRRSCSASAARASSPRSLVGAALAASGAAYQGLFRNPLVSPDILGVSAGAAFGAVLGIFLSLDVWAIQGLAFVFGLAAVGAAYAIAASLRGHDPILVLVLAGVVLGSLLGACIALVKYLADPYNQLPAITYWLLGSLAATNPGDVRSTLLPVAVGLVVLWLLRWRITVLSLGDEEAASLGIRAGRIRAIVIAAATLVTAAVVSDLRDHRLDRIDHSARRAPARRPGLPPAAAGGGAARRGFPARRRHAGADGGADRDPARRAHRLRRHAALSLAARDRAQELAVRLEAHDLAFGYRKHPVGRDVSLRARRRRDHVPAGAQRRRQDDAVPDAARAAAGAGRARYARRCGLARPATAGGGPSASPTCRRRTSATFRSRYATWC